MRLVATVLDDAVTDHDGMNPAGRGKDLLTEMGRKESPLE